MLQIEALKKRIETTRDLQSVVKTMKALAAVNIRQYERAARSIEHYTRTTEMALQVLLLDPVHPPLARGAPKERVGGVVFGSDQGMCGQLNDQVVAHACAFLDKEFPLHGSNRRILALGQRVHARLRDRGHRVEASYAMPGSVKGIVPGVQDLLVHIEKWLREDTAQHVVLFHGKQISGASYRAQAVRLLPLDKAWLDRLREKKWPTHCVPMFTMEKGPLFSALVRQHLFACLFRAYAQSLASENAARLSAMQGAEKNIEERLEELTARFHKKRQMSITEELLDIVAGWEALKQEKRG